MNTFVRLGILSILATLSAAAYAQGVIRGVVRTDAGPAANVFVNITSKTSDYRQFAETDVNGRFIARDVPAGAYDVEFSATGLQTYVESDVQVADGGVAALDVTMIAPLNIMEVMTVASASRRPERIVEAPAAVTVITNKEIAAQSSHGQLPRVLESTPGVELAQAGVFDFNVNARGFNSSLNRRILVLVDGRDPATGFLGNQEWGALSFPLDEITNLELVRGPGSALYGADAFNGVLNMTTKRPIDSEGGKLSIALGSLRSGRIDFRYADVLNDGWSYKVLGGFFGSETWSQSRTIAEQVTDIEGNPIPGEFEYSGLGATELVSLDDERVTTVYFSGRVDKEFSQGDVFTFEFGTATTEDGLAVTGIGRVRVDKSNRPWFRLNYNRENWNFMYSYTQRDTPDGQTSLATGNLLWEDSINQHLEIQYNRDFWEDRLQLVVGGAYHDEDVDTRNDLGQHTLMKEAKKEDQQAVYGQITLKITEQLDLVLAGRWDDSSLHDSQESPKAAIVYKINPNNSLRLTYNEAFQTPNFSEFFLRAASANIIPFGGLQDAVVLGGFGLDLRNVGQDGEPLGEDNGPALLDWQNIPVVAAGNPNLVPEQIESWEIGYKGIIGSKMFLTADYYQSTITNFVTDLLPGVNSNIATFAFVENLPAEIQTALLDTLGGALGPAIAAGLTNQNIDLDPNGAQIVPDGHPVIVVSYTNAGEVETEGFDVALNYYLNEKWTIDANYSWFDFEVIDQLIGDELVPNSSENKINFGVAYDDGRLSGSLKAHIVEGFPWAAGVFQGDIPDYETLNLNLSYKFGDNWVVGFVGNNILDDEHFEIFGGSINGRRILFNVNYLF